MFDMTIKIIVDFIIFRFSDYYPDQSVLAVTPVLNTYMS